ncbi:hypothetical protein [Candidatus Midichloria mitochondrii]|uniref:hypothetical protein n=1 Tax=Candidatus Midichloria mitochondrii TaxID=234827 RepID=UPI0002E0F5AE|nr:hypothetical protein [Candidatus Midichloria mitochondrii]
MELKAILIKIIKTSWGIDFSDISADKIDLNKTKCLMGTKFKAVGTDKHKHVKWSLTPYI